MKDLEKKGGWRKMSIFDNEVTWFFIMGGLVAMVGIHSCSLTDREAERTKQEEIKAKVLMAGVSVPATNVVVDVKGKTQ